MLGGGGTHGSAHGPFLLSPLPWCPEQQTEAHRDRTAPTQLFLRHCLEGKQSHLPNPPERAPAVSQALCTGTLEQAQHSAFSCCECRG